MMMRCSLSIGVALSSDLRPHHCERATAASASWNPAPVSALPALLALGAKAAATAAGWAVVVPPRLGRHTGAGRAGRRSAERAVGSAGEPRGLLEAVRRRTACRSGHRSPPLLLTLRLLLTGSLKASTLKGLPEVGQGHSSSRAVLTGCSHALCFCPSPCLGSLSPCDASKPSVMRFCLHNDSGLGAATRTWMQYAAFGHTFWRSMNCCWTSSAARNFSLSPALPWGPLAASGRHRLSA